MLQHDLISGVFIAYAALAIIWLSTFSTTGVTLFPFILLIGGLGLEWRFSRQIVEKNASDTAKLPLNKILTYSGVGLAAMLITGTAVDYLPLATIESLPQIDSFLFSTSIAVAEAIFFTGFITDMLLSTRLPGSFNNDYLKLLLSGAVFGLYHFARYGTLLDSLIYVFVGGFILNWVSYKTKRLSPSILAHVANNALKVLGL